jgi:pimeloyl-ACP methyl ester carboxylesterase
MTRVFQHAFLPFFSIMRQDRFAMNRTDMNYLAHAADGRRLAVDLAGDPLGEPVFHLHGTPGSRLQPRPSDRELEHLGVRLITFDRPGYGGSDRRKSRTVADVAQDVAAIADQLNLEKFAVLGRSGGGPHALACAALLPRRVTRAAALVSLAPRDAQDLDWPKGMDPENVAAFGLAASSPEALSASLSQKAECIRQNPKSFIDTLMEEMPEADSRIMANEGVRSMFEQNFREAFRHSAEGWADDVRAFCSPWGFDVSDIIVPVYLWHGRRDKFSPPSHTEWLASQIPGAMVAFAPDRSHFGAIEMVPSVLSWLSGRTPRVGPAPRPLTGSLPREGLCRHAFHCLL